MLTKSLLVLFILSSFLISCKQNENVEGNINSYTNAVISNSIIEAEAKRDRHLYSLKIKLYQLEYKDLA